MIENRLYNFNPGPAVLPEDVLLEARANLLNYRGSGIGIMEMSHRSKDFEAIISEAEADLRALLGIPEEYSVLFTTGGGSTQFSMVPMNLLRPNTTANFILTGVWAEAAYEEAKKFGRTHVAATSKEEKYRRIPTECLLSENCAYLHFTSNNTIVGSQFRTEPACDAPELVCDASSDFLSRRIDVRKYGLIYSGAQKNFGPAGVTLVIMKTALLERCPDSLPLMLDYRTYAKNKSLYNTPPVFAIYVCGLVFRWLRQRGGLDVIEKQNRQKADILYTLLDSTKFYEPFVSPESRSTMNVTFRISNRELEQPFLKEAEAAGLIGLKGHRLLGGLRASIYNACPLEGVEALAAFMREFEKKRG